MTTFDESATSIDAALAFAVKLVGPKDAYFILNEATLNAWAAFGGNGWIEALPQAIIAEAILLERDMRKEGRQ
jgi:hypothetical protein